MSINALKSLLTKISGNISGKNKPVKEDKSDTGILSFKKNEGIKNTEEQIKNEYLETEENDPVSKKSRELKEILEQSDPKKEDIIKLAANYGISVFNIINKYDSENRENLFETIKSKFSKEEQREIFDAMGREAAFQMLDSIEEKENIDTRGIIQHVIGNLKNDKDGCEFSKSFLSASSRVFDEVSKFDPSIINYIEKSSMDDESKTALTSKYYRQKIDAQVKLYANAAELEPSSKLITQGSSNMCWQAASYNSLMNTETGRKIAEKLINDNPISGNYSVNIGGQEIKIPYKVIVDKLGPSSPDLNATIMALAFKKLYPEGTGVTGAFALGNTTSDTHGLVNNAGSLSTFLNKVSDEYDFKSFVRDNNPLNSSKINGILDKVTDSYNEFAAVVNFFKRGDYSTIELTDFRNSEITHKVANNEGHALTLKSADDKTVTLIDPRNPNKPITISREEFCAKVQLIEYCYL